jgi:hypothetical protein
MKKMKKILLGTGSTYPLYAGRNALRDESSKKILEDYNGEEGYNEGQKRFTET